MCSFDALSPQAEEEYHFEHFEENSKFRGLLHKDGTELQKFEQNPQDAKEETFDESIDRLKQKLSSLKLALDLEKSASAEGKGKGAQNSLQDIEILEDSLHTLLNSSVQWKTL